MIAEFVRSISGIEVLGVAGLCISFLAFCVVIVRVWKTDRARCDALARLPLEPEDATPSEIRE